MQPSVEQQLHAQAAALRALARDLVGEHDADDLVQDMALQVLRSPPRRTGRLGGWFATVLRHLAWRQQRSRRRRQRHEASVPPRGDTQSPDRALEHGETLRRLTAAVLGLPLPYRQVVLRRYFEDLTPTAIATRSAVPLATVKSRLQRGLLMLRERLDADDVRDDWRAAFAGAFGLEHAAAGAVAVAATTGVLVMGAGAKLVTVGAAALAAAAAFFFVDFGTPAPATMPVLQHSAPSPIEADAGGRDPAGSDPVRQQAPAPPRREPAQPAGVATIRGRCVDADGPLGGCSVIVTSHPGDRSEPFTEPAIVTESDGRFEVALSPRVGFRAVLVCRLEGHMRRSASLGELREGQTVDLGDVAMPGGARVHGRVVDISGRPVGAAYLGIDDLPVPLGSSARERLRTRSRDDGTFAFDEVVPAGNWELSASRAGMAQVGPMSITVLHGVPALEVTVTCAPTPSIAGTVVDEVGRPIAGATVQLRATRSGKYPVTESRADGSFELFSLATDPEPAVLEVSEAEGFLLPPPTDKLAWGARDVRFVLQRGLRLEIEVVERQSRRPVEEFAAAAARANAPNRQWPAARIAQGRRTLDGFQRGPHRVAVMPQDPQLLQSDWIAVDAEQVAGPLRIEVERLEPLQVLVVDAASRPVGGSLVEVAHAGRLFDSGRQLRDLRRNWPNSGSDHVLFESPWPVLYSRATTDTEGVAMLSVAAADPDIGVRVQGPGHAPRIVRNPVLSPGRPLIVTVEPAAAIRGTIRIAGYEPGAILLALDEGDGAGLPRTEFEIAANGSFHAEGLAPSRRTLRLGLRSGGNVLLLDPPLADVTLRAGETAELALDAAPFDAGLVLGRVIVDGAGFPGALVSFQLKARRGASGLGPFVADARGAFTATGLPPGSYPMHLFLGDRNSGLSIVHEDTVVIPAGGTVDREFHFVRRRLKVRVHDAAGRPVAGREVWALLSADARRQSSTDEHGIAVFDWMPAGKAVLTTQPRPMLPGRALSAADGKEVEILPHVRESEAVLESK